MASNSTLPCYLWGGQEAERIYTPCNPSARYSMCCRTFQPVPGGRAPDTCLPNGLCAYFDASISELNTQTFWLESCSDPSWQDAACAPLAKYVSPATGTGCYRDSVGNAQLGFCADTQTYCCNQNVENTTCCDLSISGNIVVHLPIASMVPVTTSFNGQFYTMALPTLLSTTTSGGSSTGTATGLSTGISSASSNPVNGGSKGLSAGAGAGIGVAAVFVALLIGLALFWLISRHRRKRRQLQSGFEARRPGTEAKYSAPKELPTDATIEADGRGRHELQ